jgi:hypothetical protein
MRLFQDKLGPILGKTEDLLENIGVNIIHSINDISSKDENVKVIG